MPSIRNTFWPFPVALALGATAAAAVPVPKEGWPVVAGSYHEAAPALADVTGDDRPEIIALTWDGYLYIWDYKGTVLRGFPVRTSPAGNEKSSPAAADVDNDGKADVVVAGGDGRLYVFNNRGVLLPGWPRMLATGPLAGPAVQDFTNYRGLEVFASSGKKVFGLHSDGSGLSGWPVELKSEGATGPAVGDLNGDQRPEVVVAAGSDVYAFETNGAPLAGWPVKLDGVVNATPLLVDINGDGLSEVIAGTSVGSAFAIGAEGRILPGWPASLGSKPVMTSAAAGVLEKASESVSLVFLAGGPWSTNSVLAAVDGEGRFKAGFPKTVNHKIAAAPLIVDLDGDRDGEILLVTVKGTLLGFEKNGATCDRFPYSLTGMGVNGPPAAGDADGDGLLDLVVLSQTGHVELVDTRTPYDGDANQWPTAGGNPWRTYKYFSAAPPADPLTVKLYGGQVLVEWKALPRENRRSWVVFRGTKDPETGRVEYAAITEIEDQPAFSYSYHDSSGLTEGTLYYYKLEERLANNASNTYGPKSVRVVGTAAAKPTAMISKCYPNPFSSILNISFEINNPNASEVETTLAVYDISGRTVRTITRERRRNGEHLVQWDGNDANGTPVASGVYVLSLRAGQDAPPSTKTVILVR